MKSKKIIILLVGVLALVITIGVIAKINVKNTEEIPFNISKISVISGASAEDKEDIENLFNLNLIQSNDIYIDISRSKNSNDNIDKVIINGFHISKAPIKGNIHIYKSNDGTGIINNTEEYKIEDEIILTGNTINQGGKILLRCANEYLVNYVSNDEEVIYDGTMFKKAGVTQAEIEFTISFDITIELKSGEKYKTIVVLDMPTGNVLEQGIVNTEINAKDIIFKKY